MARTADFEALERRLLLNVDVDWDGADLTITCHGPNDGVYVAVGANGVQVQSDADAAPYWVGGPQNCYPGTVQSIKVVGSPFHDTIDLTQVPGIFVWNAGLTRGNITVDCTATAPNQFVGDTIKLGGFGEKADGSPYADSIQCGPNGDTVNGGGGADTITGGAGNDQLTLGGLGQGFGFNARYARIEGGGGNDVIKGGNMQSKLYGDDGNDTITAGPWGDFIDGGVGSDTLNGGSGVDTILGGGGDDTINGKSAPQGTADTMLGGTGNNWYYFDDDSPAYGHGVANDYETPEGNHPEVGGLRFLGANDEANGGNAWVTVGDKISLFGTGVTIPVPDPGVNGQPGENVTKVSYYLDTVDASGEQKPDGDLQQWDDGGDEFLGSSTPGESTPVSTRGWSPGTYTFFAIATATNGYQGNYWWRKLTVKGPQVMINAPVPQTQELLVGQPGVFDVTRDGPTDNPLTVNYTLSGTATNGKDYSTLSGTVTIPAGSADATIDVNPLDDGDGDDSATSESVVATLASTSSNYQIDPNASSATVNIAEENPPAVSISADIPNAIENDVNDDGEYVVTRTGPTDEPLTVNLDASGMAVPGTNYASLPSSVTIPAGSQTAVLQVIALEDSADGNGPETVTETVQPSSNYTVGSPSSADVSILEQPTSTVTIAADVPTTAEDSGTPGEFTVTRTAPYDSALTVSYSLSGTAVNGVDYQTLSGAVTIPANASNVVFDIVPLDDGDDASEPASSVVTATISPDPNNAYLVGAANSDSVTIAEESLPQVSIAAITPQISENGSSGTFEISRSAPADEPLTVYYTFSGSAAAGTDFTDPGESVTIPTYAYSTTITIAPLDDGDGDDTQASESLTATLSASPAYQLGGHSSATMTINEEPIPQVTVAWQSDAVENPASSGSFLVTRTGPTGNPLTVTFGLSGTAIAGTDYTNIGTTVTIPAGQSSAPITIAPIDDEQDEPSETVIVGLVNQPGLCAAVSPSSATLTIVEDGTPTVSVVSGTPTISEIGGEGSFIVSRTGSLSQPLTVYYQTDAGDQGDFVPLSGEVTIPANESTENINIVAQDDGDGDDTQTSSQVSVTLQQRMPSSYNIGPQNSASMTIDEDPPPIVTMYSWANNTYPPTITEGGADGYFFIERDSPLDDPLTVYYTVSGTAQPGVDYTPFGESITIPAGSWSGAIDVKALEDGGQYDSPGEYVTVTLTAGAYQISGPSSATIQFQEAPVSSVTVAADSDATEGGASGQFTVTRTAPYDQPLTVSYSVSGSAVGGTDYQALSGTVTIPTGSNSAVIPVAPLDDSGPDGDDGTAPSTVVMTISAPQDNSYNLGSQSSATVNVIEEPLPTVTIAAGADANEDGTQGELIVTRDGPTDLPLTIEYSVAGSALAGTDYDAVSGSVTVPTGSLSAPIYVTPIDDGDGDDTQGAETVVTTLTSSSAYMVGVARSASVNIVEEPPPTVTISADADATEDGADGQFTVSRTGPMDDPLTVNFTVSGSAISGTDYNAIGTSTTIPAGEPSATIDVAPLDDGDADDTQTSGGVQVTLSPSSTYTVGPDNTATVNIDEEPLPTVSLFASVSSTDELGSTPGEFTVYRGGPTDSALTVSYTLSGSASNGTDYASLSGTVTIAAGDDSATIEVTPLDDGADDPSIVSKDVVATLAGSSGYNIDSYCSSDTVTIMEDPVVTIAAITPTTEEFGTADGEFTVTRTGSTDEPLDVAYMLGGTAINGTDYTTLAGDVVIPAGSATATIDIAPLDDGDGDDTNLSETVVATVASGASYDVGATNTDTVTIDEEPVVTVAATTPTTVEDGAPPGVFTFTRTGPTDQAVNVSYTLSGSAVEGTDYAALSGTVTIAAGHTTATLDISPIDDLNDDDNPSETVVLTLDEGSGYSIGSSSSDTVTINEEPPPTVTIAATPTPRKS